VGLTIVFWDGLWTGGGLIGGDLYTYFLPQLQFYANSLHAGELPLWNNLSGHGYPAVGESQTAVFYPFQLLFYWLWDVNTAYNGVQLLHYVLAFVCTWMYARRLDLSRWAAGLTALVYTYGWFPSRICLAWAIVGGAWLPLALWSVESYLATRRWRYWGLLSAVLALQILAGHFNLAFITQLTLAVYVPVRLWWAPHGLPAEALASRGRSSGVLAAAVILGFALAAVQLAPSWELKQMSQRASVGARHHPDYGNIPPLYLTQVIAPWYWYTGDVELNRLLPAGSAGTNKVEAHLYFGLLPLGLLLVGFARGVYLRDRRWLLWSGLGFAALIYTTGVLITVLQHVPGFSFFMGPGRYGIVTTLAVALLAGAALDSLLRQRSGFGRALLLLVILGGTAADLWIVSRLVTYATILEKPVLRRLAQSPVRQLLAAEPTLPRLFCRGPNLANLLGVASTPPYLGIGPAAYFDPAIAMPEPLPFDEPATPAQIDWLQRAGVTHVLSFSLLNTEVWPASLAWTGVDPFLNAAWARREPLYLYQLHGSRGRIAWSTPQPGGQAEIREYRANRVTADVISETGGRLILTDLASPGWTVTIDEQPAAALTIEQMYRGVDVPPGGHLVAWDYRPQSLFTGALISLAAACGVCVAGLLRLGLPRWRPGARTAIRHSNNS
jgi:hypothetical protein